MRCARSDCVLSAAFGSVIGDSSLMAGTHRAGACPMSGSYHFLYRSPAGMSRWGTCRPYASSAGVVKAAIHEHAEQPTVCLGNGQSAEVLHPGPLPKGIHF